MAGIEPTPSKSNDWTPLSRCQLGQVGGIYHLICIRYVCVISNMILRNDIDSISYDIRYDIIPIIIWYGSMIYHIVDDIVPL